MQRLDLVVFVQMVDVVDNVQAIRIDPQVDEGLIPLALQSKDASQVEGRVCGDFMRGAENPAQSSECFPQNLFRFRVILFFDQDGTQIAQGE